MKYLTGVSNPRIREYAATEPDLGLMLQPKSALFHHAPSYSGGIAYDNGAYGAWRKGRPFDAPSWRRHLPLVADIPGVLFVTVPDVVADHDATRAAWDTYAGEVLEHHLPPAFVLQNGCTTPEQVPAEARAVFIGGDDAYKQSDATAHLCWELRYARDVWVHMGRVNSARRWLRALQMGVDSADGTFLRFGPPDLMLSRLSAWLRMGRSHGGQLDLLHHIARQEVSR